MEFCLQLKNSDINLGEIMKLAVGLANRGVDYEARVYYGGLMLVCDGWDAICHNGSYGHDRGLIEISGLPQCGDDVLGYLTAYEVLGMVDEMMAA